MIVKSQFSEIPELKFGQYRYFRWMLCFLMAFLFQSLFAQNQKIQIEKFESNPQDVTAIAHPVKDKNSHKNCALVIFKNVGVGKYEFQVNGFCQREDKTEDGKPVVWLYVAPGTKYITIANPSVSTEPLRYSVGKSLESGKTYIATMGAVYDNSNQKQFLIVNLVPPTASLEIDGEPVEVSNGRAEVRLAMGSHNVKAVSPEYHDYVDIIMMDDPTAPKDVQIKLQPCFGYLTLDGGSAVEGAVISVDGMQKGKGNIKNVKIESGENHTLKISKKLYKPYQSTFSIEDGQTTVVKPILIPNFSETTITVANNAEIWLENEKLGAGTWKGPLEKGIYIFETRLPSHKSHKQQIEIESIDEPHEITLGAPTPIYGSISVTSTPSGSQVKVDGKLVGQTPYNINDVLIGSHEVEVSRPGYQSDKKTVNVKEGESVRANFTLTNIVTAKVVVEPAEGSTLLVDGKEIYGSSPYTVSGQMNQTLHLTVKNKESVPGYKSQSLNMTLSRDGIVKKVTLQHKAYPYYAPRGFYIDMGGSALGITGATGALGNYFGTSGFNVELDFIYGLIKSDEIFYNRDDYSTSWYDGNSYSAMAFGGKIGFGIRCNRNWDVYYNEGYGKGFCITPQVGARHAMISGGLDTYVTSATAALRMEWRTSCHFAVYFVPEYSIPVLEGDLYKALKGVSSKVKGFGEGFNLRIGISFII